MSTNETTATRPRGRPKTENPRTSGFLLRLNAQEIAAITKKAQKAKKVRAEWIREILLAA